MGNPVLTRYRQYHLPGEHDQETHGNWADGVNVGDSVIWTTETGKKETVNYRGRSGEDAVIVTKSGHQVSVPMNKISALPENHPIMLKKARAAFDEQLMNTLGYAGGGEVKLRDGNSYLVSDNIDPRNRDKYPFRITRIAPEGMPAGHEIFKDWDEVTGYIWTERRNIIKMIPAKG